MKQRRVSASRSGWRIAKSGLESYLFEYRVEGEILFSNTIVGKKMVVVVVDGVVELSGLFLSSRVDGWSMLRLNRKWYVVAMILDL